MKLGSVLAAVTLVVGAGVAEAQDAAIVLGKSSFGARCALCHGADGKGGGEVSELFRVPPADLTTLAERNDGAFPFARVYSIIVDGMDDVGHGDSEMPIWGDYFISDALEDRGVKMSDAIEITQGRVLSLTYYLESIQE
ncbi:MAG: c-type cytochrome [Silicimonas sp.]|nr:c-type cytochrome [Silicimonas sp.]NNF91457.1 c-type cytochrome [Boseongicola sp.]NNL35514.1 c-type cytochrome [Silicimonas sp.]NNL74343.1 c-type cytochrome [Silicimonas sp.]RZV98460.1 MAG: c-type cytochrome [Paracoccaceae bacterium]